MGTYYRAAMSVDLVPEGRSVNLIDESPWQSSTSEAYRWLGWCLMRQGGWRDRIVEGLELEKHGVRLYGGTRPVLASFAGNLLAPRDDSSPMVFAPRYPTAETPWQMMNKTTFAFQTSRLSRLQHNTPLDRLSVDLSAESLAQGVDDALRHQLRITLAVLEHMLQYPIDLIPTTRPDRRGSRGMWGGYAHISGRVHIWDRSIGWFGERLPEDPTGVELRTFVQAYPVNAYINREAGGRLRNRLNWPINPSRGQHRELQAFMFQDVMMLERHNFRIPLIYTCFPSTQYNVVAFTVDAAGRI